MYSVSSVVTLALLLVAGCRSRPEMPAAERERLVLAQVIDETDFLAQAAQVEESALKLLWAEMRSVEYIARPAEPLPVEEILKAPGRVRGRKVFLRGKLLSVEEGNSGSGPMLNGLVLMADGGLAAFRAQIPPGADRHVPAAGSAVEVKGLFLKRWIALDGSGSRYALIPMLASTPPVELSGGEAERLAALEPERGLLPLTELDVPPVVSRPVVELDARGGLRLDGWEVSQRRLVAELRRMAASSGSTPLGESSLVAVVLVAKDAPPAARETLARELPARAVFRTAR